jgi:hypothetical protein
MRDRDCDQCGRVYVAQRSTSKFCSLACRNASKSRPSAAALAVPPPPVADGVAAVVEADLERAGRLATVAGQASLVLARRLDNGVRETGPALASLAKQLEATLASAMKGATAAPDGIDELRDRRDRKFA